MGSLSIISDTFSDTFIWILAHSAAGAWRKWAGDGRERVWVSGLGSEIQAKIQAMVERVVQVEMQWSVRNSLDTNEPAVHRSKGGSLAAGKGRSMFGLVYCVACVMEHFATMIISCMCGAWFVSSRDVKKLMQ